MKYLLLIFNPAVAILYFLFGIMETRQFVKKKNRFNLNLGVYYFITAIGLGINIFMAIFFTKFTETQYINLGRICAGILVMAQWLLIYFLAGINYGYKGILKWQNSIFLFFLGANIYLWINIGEISLTTLEDHQYISWNLEMGLLSLSNILLIFLVFIFLSFKIYRKLENPVIKKRFILLSVGIILIVLCITTTSLMNINIINRNFGAIFLTVLLVLFGPMVYSGTRKGLINRD